MACPPPDLTTSGHNDHLWSAPHPPPPSLLLNLHRKSLPFPMLGYESDSAHGSHEAAAVSREVSPDTKGEWLMTYVVCEPCHDCKYTDCVAVCPCDCFYQDEMMLYIDAEECIDCEACVP